MAQYKNADLDAALQEARSYIHNSEHIDLLIHAADYAKKHHEGKLRKSGEPYFIHLTNVAYILATMRQQPATIAAGFLHDVIEDCKVTRQELQEEFSEEIAYMVDAVTKVGMLEFKGKDDPEYQAANHRKIFIAMASDVRVIIIKLADRLHNMRTLQYQPEAAQKRIAAETLDVYAPIAHRLGIGTIKNELEDLSFFYLNRGAYYHIAHLVEAKKAERDEAVNQMIREISDTLREQGIKFRIFGRSKHLYSIYKKMETKNKRFEEILDLLAIRIITDTKQNCYNILGIVHESYKPITGRMKDYIAVPKTNLYQSLHTTVVADGGKIFEVQIRTEEMDEVAERGIAAHWRYKEGKAYDAKAQQKEIEDKLSWLKNFSIYNEENDESATGFMHSLQKDVFEANVYVMTPKGRVIELPNGATPIDFAYRIHTEIGNTTVGAVVNGGIVPLNKELHTGDVVNIKTLKGTGPSEDWLKFVKSNQARQKIRSYFQKREAEEKENKVPEGEKMLAEEIRKRGLEPREWMDRKRLEGYFKEFRVSSYTDFMYGIAVKSINPAQVVEKVTNHHRAVHDEAALNRVLGKEVPHRVSKTGLVVPGIETMRMSLAHCCLPVHGDEIVGYVTKGSGVKVHRKDCANVRGIQGNMIAVQWDDGSRDRLYDCDLTVIATDRSYLLTDIVTMISQNRVPIDSVNAKANHVTLISSIKISMRVKDLEQVNALIANVRKIDSVIDVKRGG